MKKYFLVNTFSNSSTIIDWQKNKSKCKHFNIMRKFSRLKQILVEYRPATFDTPSYTMQINGHKERIFTHFKEKCIKISESNLF